MLTKVLELCRNYPQIVVFLSLALGYLIGKVKVKGFSLGSTTSVLLVAIVLGQISVAVPDMLKTVSFGLFIFGIGYKIGPQFFGALKSGGLNYLWMALIVALGSMLSSMVLGRLFDLDLGTIAGMLAGSTTTSAALGTAEGAISHLGVSEAQRTSYANNVAIGYAITYIFGTGGTILFLKFYPLIVRFDLKTEAKKIEASLKGAGGPDLGQGFFLWANRINLRNCLVTNEGVIGKTVSGIEALFPGNIAIEKLKRDGRAIAANPDTIINKNDELSVAGPEKVLMMLAELVGPEIYDPPIMDITGEVMDVCVLNRNIVGKTLGDLSRRKEAHGVFLRGISRQGRAIPAAENVDVQKCDVLTLAGAKSDIERAIGLVGYAERPTAQTDLILVGVGIVLGTLIGLLSVKVGGIPITLGVGGGVLIAGLFFGWLRSFHPTFGQIPAGGMWLMTDLGLNLFIACVGIQAGPKAIEAIQTSGLTVLLCGAVVAILPLFFAMLFGQFVLKMNPILVMGAGAGSRDITAALLAIQDDAESSTPSLGFAAPYAFANVLITITGSLIVNIMARI